MSVLSTRWKLAAAGFIAYAAFAWYFGGDAHGQRKPAAPDKKPAPQPKSNAPITVPKKGVSKATPLYYGVVSCRGVAPGGCHSAPKPVPFDKESPVVCQLDEVTIWKKHDKHDQAYHVIDTLNASNPSAARARRMEAILGKGDPNYKVYKDPQCLACHALVVDPEVKQVKGFKISEGVNCVVCHGAYREWVDAHAGILRDEFRKADRKEKQLKYGMIDLWDPITRARLCSSCHIGSKEDGKFVTHEMYAAGHPPLPGFEPAAFSNDMPRHWKYLREKPAEVLEIQKMFVEGGKKHDFEQTEMVLVGGVVSLAESMKLLAGKATEAVQQNDALDLSNFDCYACHHDLKTPSWRQERGYKGKPGRVPMRPWSTELVKLALAYMGDANRAQEKELDAALAEVHRAFSARPYGDAPAVQKAASKLAKWADQLAATLAAKLVKNPVTEKEAKTLQQLIPKVYTMTAGSDRRPPLLDYDSAREVGWAFKAISNELLYPRKKADPAVGKALKALDSELYLTLYHPVENAKAPRIIEPDLEVRMKTVLDYNPSNFRAILMSLSNSLSRKKP